MKFVTVQEADSLYKEISSLKSLIRESNSEYIGVEETAKLLGFKKSYLYQLIHKNLIPHYKPNGKKVLFDKFELKEWISKSRVKTVNEIEGEYHSNKSKMLNQDSQRGK